MYLEGWSIHPSNSLKELHIDYQSSQCQTEIRIQYPESDNGTFGYFAIKRKRGRNLNSVPKQLSLYYG